MYIDSLSNVKVGDEVKATGSMMRNFTEYMVATAVENTTNNLGMHMKEDGSPLCNWRSIKSRNDGR